MRAPLLSFALLLTSCAAPSAEVRSWGTMREALRDGHSEARVDAAQVTNATTVGVGAAAGLAGEITIVDGRVVHTIVDGGTARDGATDAVPATLLAVADVGSWREVAIDRAMDMATLEQWILDEAGRGGIDTEKPFAFEVRGPLRDVRLHVINGQCPVRARMMGRELTKPPFERELREVEGTLVGIFAVDAAGALTHHDSSMHVHVVLDGVDGEWTGHCETVGVGEGAVLRLPGM